MFKKKHKKIVDVDITKNQDFIKFISFIKSYKECYKCGGFFNKNYLMEVEIFDFCNAYFLREDDKYKYTIESYCKNCKPPYDRRVIYDSYRKNEYFKYVYPSKVIKVDKDGEEI